jgi:leucyl-tRNA synthetase
MVVAPEHPLLEALTTDTTRAEVSAYAAAATRKSDLERTELQKGKTGVFTGFYAINPVNGKEIPIYVADYVLGSYGSGGIMAVPAHDERDFEFAQTSGLPIVQVRVASVPALRLLCPFLACMQRSCRTIAACAGDATRTCNGGVQVVAPAKDAESVDLPFAAFGEAVNSTSDAVDISGKSTEDAKAAVLAWLASSGKGAAKVNYKLRDWLFARQRYWGEPFPVVYPEGSDDVVPLPVDQLPLELPQMDEFKPSGNPESPLVNATEWLWATDPVGGGPARRDTNTMPQWAGSCWYYLRYIDPGNNGMCAPPLLFFTGQPRKASDVQCGRLYTCNPGSIAASSAQSVQPPISSGRSVIGTR